MRLCVQGFLHPKRFAIGLATMRKGLLVHLLLITISISLEENSHVE